MISVPGTPCPATPVPARSGDDHPTDTSGASAFSPQLPAVDRSERADRRSQLEAPASTTLPADPTPRDLVRQRQAALHAAEYPPVKVDADAAQFARWLDRFGPDAAAGLAQGRDATRESGKKFAPSYDSALDKFDADMRKIRATARAKRTGISDPTPPTEGEGPSDAVGSTEAGLGQGGRSATPPNDLSPSQKASDLGVSVSPEDIGDESGTRRANLPATDTIVRNVDAEAPTAGSAALKKANKKRDHWHELRIVLQKMTQDDTLSKCGRLPIPGVGRMKLRYQKAKNRTNWVNVRTCRKANLCPVCGNRIRTARGDQLAAAAMAWANPDAKLPAPFDKLRDEKGGGLAMGTFTLKHYRRTPLAHLIKVQRKAWSYAFGRECGKNWQKVRARYGIIGDVRVFETTWGSANGWHPHFHVTYFLARPLTEAQRKELEQILFQRWEKAVGRAGGYTLSRKYGVRLDVPKNGDVEAFARYIAKEMTGLLTKTGQKGRRTPWQIAQDYAETKNPQDMALWAQYEDAIRGVWWLRWSDNLNPLAQHFDGRTEEEIVDASNDEGDEPAAPEPETGPAFIDVLGVRLDAWFQVILKVPTRRLDAQHAFEGSGLTGLRALLESWNLTWGHDVWSDLDDSTPPDFREPAPLPTPPTPHHIPAQHSPHPPTHPQPELFTC
ncbi:hypothetical protein OS965_34550 [Streptomyces sp. H27-G5]|uniref:hypothetical protein n=1 Tax=Streptomyces sp. H27-G5 TaxID=2996698 RepID=UPI00227208E7|nr:hypothetical protein [Streptomyces sp. H27-G5]MCY0923200.1 hypothetical protein [Streptomyces sp. H27-G5]